MDKETIKEVFEKIREISCMLGDNSNMEWILQSIEHILLYTESPIERKFLFALITEIIDKNVGTDLFENPILIWTNQIEDLFPAEYWEAGTIAMLFINPIIGNYRPDIVLSTAKNKIIFEIDGFQYHNTKKQLTSDKKRERELGKLGYKIYRFSGTELHQNEKKVAEEALEIIYREFNLKEKNENSQ